MTFWSGDQCEVPWHFEKFTFPIWQDLSPLNLAGCWLLGGASACKRLRRHRVLFLFWIIFNSIKQTQNLKEKTNCDFDKLKQLHVLIQHPTSWYIHFIQRCNYELCLKHNFSRKNQRIIFSTKSITGSLYYNKSRTRYSQKMNQFALNALQWSNPFSRVQSFHLPIYSIII